MGGLGQERDWVTPGCVRQGAGVGGEEEGILANQGGNFFSGLGKSSWGLSWAGDGKIKATGWLWQRSRSTEGSMEPDD